MEEPETATFALELPHDYLEICCRGPMRPQEERQSDVSRALEEFAADSAFSREAAVLLLRALQPALQKIHLEMDSISEKRQRETVLKGLSPLERCPAEIIEKIVGFADLRTPSHGNADPVSAMFGDNSPFAVSKTVLSLLHLAEVAPIFYEPCMALAWKEVCWTTTFSQGRTRPGAHMTLKRAATYIRSATLSWSREKYPENKAKNAAVLKAVEHLYNLRTIHCYADISFKGDEDQFAYDLRTLRAFFEQVAQSTPLVEDAKFSAAGRHNDFPFSPALETDVLFQWTNLKRLELNGIEVTSQWWRAYVCDLGDLTCLEELHLQCVGCLGDLSSTNPDNFFANFSTSLRHLVIISAESFVCVFWSLLYVGSRSLETIYIKSMAFTLNFLCPYYYLDMPRLRHLLIMQDDCTTLLDIFCELPVTHLWLLCIKLNAFSNDAPAMRTLDENYSSLKKVSLVVPDYPKLDIDKELDLPAQFTSSNDESVYAQRYSHLYDECSAVSERLRLVIEKKEAVFEMRKDYRRFGRVGWSNWPERWTMAHLQGPCIADWTAPPRPTGRFG